MKLTDHKIQALGEGVYADPECPGLQVRIGTDRRTFYATLRLQGKKVMKRLGLFPSMRISEARMMVHRLRNGEEITQGKEGGRKGERRVSDLLEDFVLRHIPTVSERTGQDYHKAVAYFSGLIGNLKVDEIDRHLCQRLYDDIPGGGAMANRHLAAMRKAWNLMEDQNPWMKVLKKKESPRSQYATSDELNRIMDAVLFQSDPDTRGIYILLLTTACRKGEAQGMRWEDIDGNVWHKPKTKNGKAHRIVLPNLAHEAINALPHREGKIFRHNGFSNSWLRIKKMAGIEKPLTIHDLRRSIGIELLKSRKVGIKDISNLLGHSSVAITERVYAPYLGDNREAVAATEEIFKRPETPPKPQSS